MMLHTVWQKTLRDHRIGIIGWGLGLGSLILILFRSANPLLLVNYAPIARSFAFIGNPAAITTIYGYVTFRGMGLLIPVLLSIWALLMGASLVREEEERGSLDVLLSTPPSRVRVYWEKVLALTLMLLLVGLFLAVATMLGEAGYSVPIDVLRAITNGLNASILACFFGSLAFLLSQIVQNRAATVGYTAIILTISYILGGIGRVTGPENWLQYLSPFAYYNANTPLVSSASAQPSAAAFLLTLNVILLLLGLFLFLRRDIGQVPHHSVLFNKDKGSSQTNAVSLQKARDNFFERNVLLHTIRMQALGTGSWIICLGLYAFLMTLLTSLFEKPMQQLIESRSTSVFVQIFGEFGASSDQIFFTAVLFSFLPILLVLFAFVQALYWPATLNRGRAELIISSTPSRARIFIGQFGALVLMLIISLVFVWFCIVLGTHLAHLDINIGRLAIALFGLFPLMAITAALVYTLTTMVRYGAVVGITCILIILSFIGELLEKQISPVWLLNLSIFHVYGDPLISSVPWVAYVVLFCLTIGLLLLGMALFHQSDIDRGA